MKIKLILLNIALLLFSCFIEYPSLRAVINLKVFNETQNPLKIQLNTPYNRTEKIENKKIILYSSSKLLSETTKQFSIEPNKHAVIKSFDPKEESILYNYDDKWIPFPKNIETLINKMEESEKSKISLAITNKRLLKGLDVLIKVKDEDKYQKADKILSNVKKVAIATIIASIIVLFYPLIKQTLSGGKEGELPQQPKKLDETAALKILGITDRSEAKKAFHKLSLKYHPDKWKPELGISREESAEKFNKAKEAYEVLK